MMIICNGFPKCGVHALSKTCGLLGQKSMLTHLPYSMKNEALAQGAHLFIIRDPRNALISRLRMDEQQLTEGNIILRIKEYEEGDNGFVDAFVKYQGWLKNKQTLVVRFEDLIKNDAETKRIADHLKVTFFDDAFDNLEGFTYTWTGEYSRWQDHWTDNIQAVWKEYGGNNLLEVFGYE